MSKETKFRHILSGLNQAGSDVTMAVIIKDKALQKFHLGLFNEHPLWLNIFPHFGNKQGKTIKTVVC